MIVYTIKADRANKKILVFDEDPNNVVKGTSKLDFETFDCLGKKKATSWNPPPIRWFDDDGRNLDKYKDPDITYISMAASLLVNQRTKELLVPAVSDIAELLPVPVGEEIWYFLNVVNQVDAMNKASSQYKIYRDGSVGYLQKAGFFPEKVPHAKLFTIPEDRAMIYYAEHHADSSPNTFKNILEQNKLFGIKLEKQQEY
jgi:hypothetical protein